MLDELLQERLEQFNPEPLIKIDPAKTKENIERYVIKEDEDNIDFAKVNFLNILNDDEIKKSSEEIIRKYGVGTCGPRAFYGTTDVHLELEKRLAEFFNTEEAIVYSYGFVAISSSIAAYCKKKDLVFIDKEANFPIRQGLAASKSTVIYFDHNDPKSLLQEIQKVKKPSRKFLILEGISWKTGKLLPLPEFLKIAEDFKMRIFLDETYSIGIYGESGRGLTEHFNVDINRIDMIMGTLESAIGSIGGFCVGSKLTIDHQRLGGSGYIFSASQPTFLVQVCLEALKKINGKPQKLRTLAKKVDLFLRETCEFQVESDPESAFKVFKTTKDQEIFEYCKANGVHLILNESGIVMNLNVALDKERLERAFKVLEEASKI